MTLQERLAEAETALHEMMLGRGVRVVVDQNGERVEYSVGNKADLLTYIANLKDQIANLGKARVVGAMRPWF